MSLRVPEPVIDASFCKGYVDELLKGEMPGLFLRQSQAVPRCHAVRTYAPFFPAANNNACLLNSTQAAIVLCSNCETIRRP